MATDQHSATADRLAILQVWRNVPGPYGVRLAGEFSDLFGGVVVLTEEVFD